MLSLVIACSLFRYSATDGCCRRRCYGHEPCDINVKGCAIDNDCMKGLECSGDGVCIDVNECSDVTSDGFGLKYCGANADCTNTDKDFTCTCHTGYENFVPTYGCTDIDECSDGIHDCKRNTICTNTPGSHECACEEGYDGDPLVNCFDIDECEAGGKHACTFSEKTGVPDMACINWPGTYQCVDAGIMSGGSTTEFHLIMGKNRDYYKESIVKCKNHRMPDMPEVRRYHDMAYVNDYLYICGGQLYGTVTETYKTCHKFNLWNKVFETMPSMDRMRRHHTLHYVDDKIYAIGGYNDMGLVGETMTHCERTVEAFDLKPGQWGYVKEFRNGVGEGIHRHCSVSVCSSKSTESTV